LEEGIYIKLFETSAVPTLYVFSKKVKLANRAVVKLFERFGIGDLEGAGFSEIWPRGTESSGKAAFSDLEQMKPGKYELTLPDGTELVVGVKSIGKKRPENGIITIDIVAGPALDDEALKVNHERYGTSGEMTDYGTVIIQDALIKHVDPSVAQMCGYTAEEVLDTPFSDYVEPTELPKINDNYKRRMDGEYVAPMYETVVRHKNGDKVYVDVNAVIIKYQGKFADMIFVRDITERRAAEKALGREREAFHLMAEASIQSKVIPDLCQKVLAWFVNTMGFESGFIRLYDKETGLLRPTITVGLSEKEMKRLIRSQSLDDPKHTAAYVARTQQAVFAPDLSEYEISQARMLKLQEFDGGALICWPILGSNKELLGVIQLNSHMPKDIPDEDRRFFETVAGIFATLLERKRAEEAITDSERTYRGLYDAALAVIRETRLEDVSRVIADRVTELLDAAGTSVYLMDRERNVLVPVYSDDDVNREAILAFEVPVGKGLSGRIAETGAGAFINMGDKDDYAIHVPGTDESEDENESIIGVPMFDGDDVLGVIFANRTADIFADDDLKRLTAFAYQAEVAIKRARDLDFIRESLVPLRESEEKFRTVFETAEDAIFIKDAKLKYTNANPAGEGFFGVPASEVIGRTDDDLFGKVPAASIKETDYRVLSGETVEEEVTKLVNDVPTTFHVIKVPVRDEQGEVYRVCGIARDITERKKSEERVKKSLKEKEVLLKETHHRVKNNLQIISSLLSLQAGYVKDEKLLDVFRDSQKRIRSMALIHEKFYQAENSAGADFSGYVRDLILSLFSTYRFDTSAVDLQTNIGDVFLDIDTSIPLALIINELISNSLEHAFPGDGKGRIRVDLNEEDGGRFRLTVADDGVGLPENFDIQSTESLGLRLVAALVEQLDGNIEIDTAGGTRFDITFSSKRRAEG
jgi:PAS domain S-box-containing protein